MNESQRRSYIAIHGVDPDSSVGKLHQKLRGLVREGQLHGGVVGAHPTFGGVETSQAEIDADEHRFGPEAKFTMGPDGRDTMTAGHVPRQTKTHVDTEPYLRRREGSGVQLPLESDDPAFTPTDPLQHFVRLKHPHLAENYSFEKSGNDRTGHGITVYHREGNAAVSGVGRVMTQAKEQHVGSLYWNGAHDNGEHAPGEIQMVTVHPDHRGAGISTAMWDYAQAHAALRGSHAPVHSKDRSTAGNHWAHFVGGAAMARTEGHDMQEYESSWRPPE